VHVAVALDERARPLGQWRGPNCAGPVPGRGTRGRTVEIAKMMKSAYGGRTLKGVRHPTRTGRLGGASTWSLSLWINLFATQRRSSS
jgi:hypothetical protein